MDLEREAIVSTFLAETEEGLAAAEQAVMALESCPGDPGNLGDLFRVVHTLKGNAASLGLDAPVRFAHLLEDLLDELRQGRLPLSDGLVTLLLQAIDALRRVVPAAAGGDDALLAGEAEVMCRVAQALTRGGARAAGPAATERAAGRPAAAVWHGPPTLRLEVAKLDRMMDLSGEVAVAGGRLRQLIEEHARELPPELLAAFSESERLQTELREQVMKARMVPVGPAFRSYARLVRDLSASLGKRARLSTEGEEVELDTAVIEKMRDPLTHMIRNCLDHGIESPAARLQAGKDPCGQVSLQARHVAGAILIRVSDAGAGLDRAAIERRARARGLADADRLGERELHRLVFQPGFSTAASVTDVSGRGIGLDVVRRNVEAIGGVAEVESSPGQGTTFTLRLPLTLAIIDGLLVAASGDTYVVPLGCVTECLEVAPDALTGGHGVLELRGRSLPCLRLRDAFALPAGPAARQNVGVVKTEAGSCGLLVDELIGERQTVIKPLGPVFKGVPGVAGSTILGSGRVALILDVPALVERAVHHARSNGNDGAARLWRAAPN